jgi:cytoskeletal protein RodZ
MTTNIPENKARQGGLGRPVLVILVAGLILAAIAWGIAEFYGEQAKGPSTQQNNSAAASSGSNPASSDPDQSKTDNVNGEPVDQNPKVERNPTPQSSTGGDQPKQPTSP